jgi:hypoxanthine phosphoribosyltransferase
MWQYLQTTLELLGYIFALIGLGASVYQAYKAWSSINKLNWKDIDTQTKKLIRQIAGDGYQPDVIVTVGRGGSIIGAILSGNLPTPNDSKERNITLLGADRMYEWKNGRRIEIENKTINFTPLANKKVLLVAGDLMTGGTMEFFSSQIEQAGATEIRCACLIKGVAATFQPHYFAKEIQADFEMPWMYNGYGYIRDSRRSKDYKKPSWREKWNSHIR